MATPSVPVLAFHAIEPGPGPLRIEPHTFAAVVSALRDAGATGVSASTAAMIVRGEVASPHRPVAFTFDDGYRSVVAHAFPVLHAAGWPGTIFPVTSALGRRNSWDGGTDGELEIMTAEDVRALHSAGWEVGGHTHTHPSLRGKDEATIVAEVEHADAVISELVGAAPESFAYPFGAHDALAERVLRGRYRWCWTIGAQRTARRDPSGRLPRVEAWYVRRPIIARHLHDGAGAAWLSTRRSLRRVRAAFR